MWFVLDAFLTDSDRIQAFEIILSYLISSLWNHYRILSLGEMIQSMQVSLDNHDSTFTSFIFKFYEDIELPALCLSIAIESLIVTIKAKRIYGLYHSSYFACIKNLHISQ